MRKVRGGGCVEHNIPGRASNGGMATKHNAAMGNNINSLHVGYPPHVRPSHCDLTPPGAHSSCDPHLRGHHCNHVALPPLLFMLPLQATMLWMTVTNRPIGSAPLVMLVSLLAFALAAMFKHVDQNYVVGICNMWTFQSTCMWEDTHFVALVMFAMADGVGNMLVFFVPQGVWQLHNITCTLVATCVILWSLKCNWTWKKRKTNIAQIQ